MAGRFSPLHFPDLPTFLDAPACEQTTGFAEEQSEWDFLMIYSLRNVTFGRATVPGSSEFGEQLLFSPEMLRLTDILTEQMMVPGGG